MGNNFVLTIDTTNDDYKGSFEQNVCSDFTEVIIDDNTTYTAQNWNYSILNNVYKEYKVEYVIPDEYAVTTIPSYAFGDEGLNIVKYIQIPSSVTSIGESPFAPVFSLYFCSTTPPTADAGAFTGYLGTLYVPTGSVSAYQNATNYPSSSSRYDEWNPPSDMPTTLNGALELLGETMAANLTAKGVTASASDGLTTLANKILDIQGGGGVPCYKVEFTNKSLNYSDWDFTQNGHCAVLEVYLQYQYEPYSGTVTVSDGTNTYSVTTNAQGIGTLKPPITENSTTFTASYTNTTDTITVTKSNFLFVDACNSSSGLSNYGSSVMMYRGSSKTGNPASTISYNSTMNAYDFHSTNTSTSYFSMIPITASGLSRKTNYVAEVMLYQNANYTNGEVGVYVRNDSMDDSTEGFGSTMMNYNNRLYGRKLKVTQSTANNTINLESGAMPYQHWYKVMVYVTDSRIDIEWYDSNGNLLTDRFGLALTISNKQFGLLMKGGSVANTTCYVKNIKVRSTATS